MVITRTFGRHQPSVLKLRRKLARSALAAIGLAAAVFIPAATANAAVPTGYSEREMYTCSDSFTLVQSAPDGYVVGNCLGGTNFRQQSYSTSNPDGGPLTLHDYWSGGWVYGHFNGCGWIRSENLSPQQPSTITKCSSVSIGYQLSEFALFTNGSALNSDCNVQSSGTPGTASYSSKCTDGSSVNVVGACPLWANFRPWTSEQDPTDPISGSQSGAPGGVVAAGTRVRWRYVAKYPAKSTNAYYVMVRVPGTPTSPVVSGGGNWGFIDADCLELPLPYLTGIPG